MSRRAERLWLVDPRNDVIFSQRTNKHTLILCVMWTVGEIDRNRRRRNTREGWAAEEGELRVTWDSRCPHHPHSHHPHRPVKRQAESALLYAGWRHENESRHQQVHQIRTTLLTTVFSILIISASTQNGNEKWSDIWGRQLLPQCKAVFLPTCFICKCVSACTLSLSVSVCVCVALVPDYDHTHSH